MFPQLSQTSVDHSASTNWMDVESTTTQHSGQVYAEPSHVTWVALDSVS